jgi:hypothetical protein
MTNVPNSKVAVVGAVGVTALIAAYLIEAKARKTASAIIHAVSPLNNDNVFTTAVDDVGRKITGQKNWSLGVWIYDITHGIKG